MAWETQNKGWLRAIFRADSQRLVFKYQTRNILYNNISWLFVSGKQSFIKLSHQVLQPQSNIHSRPQRMPFPITHNKIQVPRRRPELLSRMRLIHLLDELMDRKLLILAAPAGYGKTSLLIDYAYQSDFPVSWFSIDALDRDPLRFLSHLVAAIQKHFPGFGAASLSMLEAWDDGKLNLEQCARVIGNDIFENIQEKSLLILDDFHLLNSSVDIQVLLQGLLQASGDQLHFLLSTRTLLDIPDLPLLIARSQVGGISQEDLAFEPGEIQSLLLQNYGITLSDEMAESITQEAEGWITGVLLSAETMRRGMLDRLRTARVSGVNLYDYLAQQVLEQHPPDVQDFLLRSALIEEFDSDFCAQVLGPGPDYESLIETVQRSNLFVLPANEDGTWIRYHHLFQDFLQSTIKKQRPQEWEGILYRLGKAYANQEDWEKAYQVIECLGDTSQLADLIATAGPHMLKAGRPELLRQWLEALPKPNLTDLPALRTLYASAIFVLGETDEGLEKITQAIESLRLLEDPVGLATALIRRSEMYRQRGEYQSSILDAREALSILEEQPGLHLLIAEAMSSLGTSLLHVGEIPQSIDVLRRASAEATAAEDTSLIALIDVELGLAYVSTGQYQLAIACYQRSIQHWQHTHQTVRQSALLNNLAVLYHLLGDYQPAIDTLEQAYEVASTTSYGQTRAIILSGIGFMYAELDAFDAARQAYHQAQKVAKEVKARYPLAYATVVEADLDRRLGNYEAAIKLLEIARPISTESQSIFEYAWWEQGMGKLALSQGDPERAVQLLKDCLEKLIAGGQTVEATKIGVYLALALLAAGDQDGAIQQMHGIFNTLAGVNSQYLLVPALLEAQDLLEVAVHDPLTAEAAALWLERTQSFVKRIPSLRRHVRKHARVIPFDPPYLTITSLGQASVAREGKAVKAPEWQNQRKVREVFYYLVSRPEGQTREGIGLVFWPDSSPEQLKLNLRNTFYRLRRSLGNQIILFDQNRYWFNRDIDYEYDAESFEEAVQEARAAQDRKASKAAYEKAVAMYRTPYLPDANGTWAITERERLRGLYVHASLTLARLRIEDGENHQALEGLDRLLTDERWIEEAHRQAMRAYAAMGNKCAVARQYQECKRFLMEDLGASPSSRTEELYKALNR